MAKKNIITDFNSLKGKLSFSENCRVVEGESSDGVVRKPTASKRPSQQGESVDERVDSVLKVGQKVVLMDSDLRGKIVSLGKTVSIELEDGFVIQAAYGEFAVTRDTEVSALKQSRVKGHHAGRTGKTSSSGKGNTGGQAQRRQQHQSRQNQQKRSLHRTASLSLRLVAKLEISRITMMTTNMSADRAFALGLMRWWVMV